MKKRSPPQYPHNQTPNHWILPCSHKFKIFNLRENCMQTSAICVQQCSKKTNPKHLKTLHRPQTQQELLKNIFYKIQQSQKISNLTNSLYRDYENSETYFKQIGNIMEVKIKQVCNQALKSENNQIVGKLLEQLFQGRICQLKCHEMNMIFNCERQFSSFTSRKLVDLEVAVKSEIFKLLTYITETCQRVEGHFQNTIEMFSKIRKPQQIQQPLQQQQNQQQSQQAQQSQVFQAAKPTVIISGTQKNNQPDKKKTQQSDKDKRISPSQVDKNTPKATESNKSQPKAAQIQKTSLETNKNVKLTPKEAEKKTQLKNIIQKPMDNTPKTSNITPFAEKMIFEGKEQKVLQTPKPQLKKALDKSNLPTPRQKTQQPQQQQKPKQKQPQTPREPNKQIKQLKQQTTPNLQKIDVPQNKTQKKQENRFWNMVQSFKRTNSVAGIFDDQKDPQCQILKDQLKKKVKITTQDDQKPKVCIVPLTKENIQQKQVNSQNNQNQQNMKKQGKMVQPSINSMMNQRRAQLQSETYNPFGRKINTPGLNLEKKDPAKLTPTQKIQKQSTTISKKPEDFSNVLNKKGFMEEMKDQESEDEIFVPRKPQQYPPKPINKEGDPIPKPKDPIVTIGKEEELRRVQMKELPKQAGPNKSALTPTQVGEAVRRNDQANINKSEKVIPGEAKNETSKSFNLLSQVKAGSFMATGNKQSQYSFLSKPTIYEDKPEKQGQKVDNVPLKKQAQNKKQGPKPLLFRKPISFGKVGQTGKKQLPQLMNQVFERAGRFKQQQIERQLQFNQISLHGELQQQSTSKQPISETKQIKQEIKHEAPQQQKEQSQLLTQEKQKQQSTQQRRFNFNNNNYLQSRNAFKDWR